MRKQTIRPFWGKRMQRACAAAAIHAREGRRDLALSIYALVRAEYTAARKRGPRIRQPQPWQGNNRKDAQGHTLRWVANELVPRFAA